MDGWLVVKISREWTEIIVYNKSLGHPRIWYKDFPKVCNEFSYYPQQISCTYGTHITYEMAEVIGIALQGSSKNVKTVHLETWLGLALQHCSKNMKIVDLETWLSYASFSSIVHKLGSAMICHQGLLGGELFLSYQCTVLYWSMSST